MCSSGSPPRRRRDLIATITVSEQDAGPVSATDLAARPGTTEGFMALSGGAGPFVYRLESLAQGARQANGG
ncbi:hypothetical protein ASF17_14485 [Frigoribacterium sp. Leaf263]|nr:hypothetical protein ASF17_14485 [Frigoribacterium sp. Leaf263]